MGSAQIELISACYLSLNRPTLLLYYAGLAPIQAGGQIFDVEYSAAMRRWISSYKGFQHIVITIIGAVFVVAVGNAAADVVFLYLLMMLLSLLLMMMLQNVLLSYCFCCWLWCCC